MDYKIKKISEVNTKLLEDFYKTAFPSRYKSLAIHWKWYYKIGVSNFEPLILEYDSKVVGMAGLIPENLSFQGKIQEAIWFTDFHVLKDYRNKGFGSILTKEWMKICPIQITFCNEESLKIFKKFNWKNNNKIYRKINPLNPFKLIPIIRNFNIDAKSKLLIKFLKKNLKEDKDIKPEKINNKNLISYCEFEEKNKIDNEFFAIIRDEKWFRWRLIDCPYSSEIFEFKNNKDIVVCHISKINNLTRLNILYTCIEDQENNEILNLIYNWCLNNNIDFIWTLNTERNKIFKETILDNLFLKKKINFAYWAKDNDQFTHLEKGLSNPQGFDSDLESILYQGE
ncbi:GNAT family N-acetyltransferase [Pelagibacterales bacterium SAG-MED29]|nr:GNAT family N-acetyltransferase [Pelagibacterales bacterium SAG-MED29]